MTKLIKTFGYTKNSFTYDTRPDFVAFAWLMIIGIAFLEIVFLVA